MIERMVDAKSAPNLKLCYSSLNCAAGRSDRNGSMDGSPWMVAVAMPKPVMSNSTMPDLD